MAKRLRYGRESLTGGTGDVNPQFMSFRCTPAVAGTTEVWSNVTPINRLPSGGGAAVIMEILKVWMDFANPPDIAAVGETSVYVQCYLCTSDPGVTTATSISDPKVFAWAQLNRRGAFTAGGTYSQLDLTGSICMVDLTDDAGHGILVASDTIYTQLSGTAAWATAVNVRIMYRMKRVGLSEYIGIVQSQS